MVNQYGSNYGTEYIFFPLVERTQEELRELITLNGGSECGNLWNLTRFHKFNEREIECNSNDIWSQSEIWNVSSIEEAVKYYFHD